MSHHHHQYHEDPVSTLGGFLLLAGFLVTTFALLVGLIAASGLAAARGATALQGALDAVALYVTPLVVAGLVLVFLGLALDLRRMARTLYESAEHAVDAVEGLSRANAPHHHSQHAVPAVRHTEPTTDSLARPRHEQAASNREPARRTTPTITPAETPRPTHTVSPAAMPRPASDGTRSLRIPTTSGEEDAPPWSGGPGAPPPGPEPGQQPPQWHHPPSNEGTPSARPEGARHSRARVSHG